MARIESSAARLERLEARFVAQEVRFAEQEAENRELRARTSALEAETRGLRAQLAPLATGLVPAQRGGGDATSTVESGGDGEAGDPREARGLSRRRALAYFGASGAGAAAVATFAAGQPTAADHLGGGIGHYNEVGFLPTTIHGTSSDILFEVQQAGATQNDAIAIVGRNVNGGSIAPGIFGINGGGGPGVEGFSANAAGVLGESVHSNAVEGRVDATAGPNGFNGVYGATSSTGNGVFGEVSNTANTANAVLGIHKGPGNSVFGFKDVGVAGDAVVGLARTGRGLLGISGAIGVQAQGTRAPLYLVPGEASAPTTGAHQRGEVYVDSAGGFWACVTSGTPGVWRKLAAPGAAGAFHLLATPARVYDSRPGTLPAQGPKTPLPAGNVARTIDLKLNNSGVPAGATGALVTVLLVNATSGAGNFTMWASDRPKPLSNTMVWGGDAGRFTCVAATALSPQALVKVDASLQTNLVLDVVGYYR